MKVFMNYLFPIAIIMIGLLLVGCPQNDITVSNEAIQKWTDQLKITASDGADSDDFGYSVAISGDYAIVGAYLEDFGGTNRGAAYIYHRTGPNTWDSEYKIIAPDGADNDNFGISVAISGDYIIVGAYNEDGAGTNRGAAYIFYKSWIGIFDAGIKIIASDSADNDYFGWSVAISGDYAIAGAYGEDGAGTNRGATYVFHRTGPNSWDTGYKITASDGADNDYFGSSVSISGNYAIAGAPFEDGTGNARGASYIFFRWNTNSWDAGVKLTAFDAADDDQFGTSVAVSGDYAIVGAINENGTGTARGAGYIFHRTALTNTWGEWVKITASDAADNDWFGWSVAISGEYAIVGAINDETGAGTNRGAGYIFHRTGTNSWDTGLKIIASDGADNDDFGSSVAISGDYAINGAFSEDGAGTNRGAAYIFK